MNSHRGQIVDALGNDHAASSACVVAVIVTFQPLFNSLKALLDALGPQVCSIVLEDNGSDASLRPWLYANGPDNLRLRFLGENRGLAAAQNIGIEEARALGAEFVLLLDQDSVPAPDMVFQLLAAARAKQASGCRLAAVGPRYFDTLQGQLRPFVRISGLRVQRFDCVQSGQVLAVDHLIASGSLIPLATLNDIGGMNEQLFIDYVDTEWCLRASRKGYELFGVCDASMLHGLGEAPNYFFGRYVPIHTPQRHYYLIRNAVWMFRQDWIPLTWKLATTGRLLLKILYLSILRPERLEHVRMMSLGLWHGLRNRMGRYPT